MRSDTYEKKLDLFSYPELEDEENKLKNLLNSVHQEWRDREETIHHIAHQLDQVRARLNDHEATAFQRDTAPS